MEEDSKNTELFAKWLEGDLTEEERKQLETTEGQLTDLQQVVDDMTTWKVGSFDVDVGLAAVKSLRKEQQAPPKQRQLLTYVFRIAATFTLLLVCYIVWDYYLNAVVNVQTGIAQTKEITLPSGSTVKLDVASSLSYNKRTWQEERKIQFNGQALFEVSKGKSFIVETSQAKVQVLGTRFNLKNYDKQFEAQCFEGTIRVEVGAKSTEIKAGETIRLVDEQLEQVASSNDAPGWIQGYSDFKTIPLTEVVKELQRYYSLEIVLPYRYQSLKFTGRFVHNEAEKALLSVFTPMEINYTLTSDGRVEFD